VPCRAGRSAVAALSGVLMVATLVVVAGPAASAGAIPSGPLSVTTEGTDFWVTFPPNLSESAGRDLRTVREREHCHHGNRH